MNREQNVWQWYKFATHTTSRAALTASRNSLSPGVVLYLALWGTAASTVPLPIIALSRGPGPCLGSTPITPLACSDCSLDLFRSSALRSLCSFFRAASCNVLYHLYH